jgi:adenylate cyclase
VKFTFRATFLGILLMFIAVTVALVGISSYYNARFTADDLSTQLMQQTSARVEEQVQKLLTAAVDESATSRRLLDAGRLHTDDVTDLVRYWLEAVAVHRELSAMFVGMESAGQSSGVSRLQKRLSIWQSSVNASTGRLEEREFWPEGYPSTPYAYDPAKRTVDIRTRPWYVAAKAAHHSIWSETYAFLGVGSTGEVQGVTYAEPVYAKDGALRGVLAADFDLKGLCAFLQTLHVGERGFAFVIERRADGSERLIAHPDAHLLTAANSGATGAIADSRVRALRAAGGAPAGFQTIHFSDGGERYFGVYHPLAGADAPPWRIGIVLPEADVLARVNRSNAITLAIALGAFGLAIVFGVWVARQVARPLEALSGEMARIADLELATRPIAHSIVLEVDRVAMATEEMKAGLRSFQKYVPSDLVRSILSSGREASLGGERRRVTIYFSDIVDFTTISERLSPEALVEHLRAYLGAMNGSILERGGTVDKFIGDAVMAFWGAPSDNPRHALDACRAALANQRALVALNARWEAEGKPALHTRIGLNSGEVVVGNVGSETRLNYTVIGDAVNLASRLEGLNKYYGTRIMLGEETRADAGDAIVTRPLDWVSVKGRAQAVQVFELLGLAGEVDAATVELAACHGEALAAYRARRWDEAIRGFQAVLASRPGDGPAALMIRRATAFRAEPPPDDWDGVYRLDSK